jgi:hypothetical protein
MALQAVDPAQGRTMRRVDAAASTLSARSNHIRADWQHPNRAMIAVLDGQAASARSEHAALCNWGKSNGDSLVSPQPESACDDSGGFTDSQEMQETLISSGLIWWALQGLNLRPLPCEE